MLNIYSIEPFSLLDYPGELTCILFTFGCNMRCGYCHNPELVLPKKNNREPISHKKVLTFLNDRKHLLDAVSICGGEPTIHSNLPAFLRRIRQIGYKIKLDTNGQNPAMLKEILREGLVDFLAMDIKMPFDKYHYISPQVIGVETLQKSTELIINSGIHYEFRTTVLPHIHTPDVIQEMAQELKGAQQWVLQGFRNGEVLSEEYAALHSASYADLQTLLPYAQSIMQNVTVR